MLLLLQSSSFALPLIGALLASLAMAGALVLTTGLHGRFTFDVPVGVQKVHARPTPRVGGLALYLALAVALLFVDQPDARRILEVLIFAGAPALVAGLVEDITRHGMIGVRLGATLASGLAACALTGTALAGVGVPAIDGLFEIPLVALTFTAFAIAGVANAVNMIDGFHGLASGTTLICLLCLSWIAGQCGDTALLIAGLTVAAAVVGFWFVNFPWGRLFLGDGGAYFAGIALAWIAVLLPTRNPQVSPWASLLVCGYPVLEATYSIARRIVSGRSALDPDSRHFHSLVAGGVRRRLRGIDATFQNAAVSVLMWICAAVPALIGVTYSSSTFALAIGATACVLLYHSLYRRVARP
jgi:UDP-N-acetylmuramyl pentapeptide phosphotransferase/UDP-N-acetylglucosamine-1-phosphate transferase